MNIIKSISFGFRIVWDVKKAAVLCCFIAVIVQVAWYYLGMFIPRLVVDNILAGTDPLRFITVVGAAALVFALINFLRVYSETIVDQATALMGNYHTWHDAVIKEASVSYELLENPDFMKAMEKYKQAWANNALNIPKITVSLAVNVINFILYGGIIIALSPVIILLLGISVAINALFLHFARKYEQSTREYRSVLLEKIMSMRVYMRSNVYAKDIRLYNMTGFFSTYTNDIFGEYEKAEAAVAAKNIRSDYISALMILLRDGAAYVFLIYLVISGQITMGEFVFVFAAIAMFSTWIMGINQRLSELLQAASAIRDIRNFLDYPDISPENKGHPLPDKNMLPPSLSFKNVSYVYPETDKPILKNINLEIKAGERIAIVGNNGAGKTTIVKLLCGLYYPTSGEVHLNGISSAAYHRDDYYKLFSAVFQDIHLIAENIAVNISQQEPEQPDYGKINECLKLSGLYDKVQSLPDGLNTMLVRQVNPDAAGLSGGEKQKLAISRALYKDAAVIILDEPTSALDPIAEQQVYEQYASLMKGKTSVFISHRLASTRFCERILLIDEGEIIEMGSHDELMSLGGKYAEMFEIQSQYYKGDLA